MHDCLNKYIYMPSRRRSLRAHMINVALAHTIKKKKKKQLLSMADESSEDAAPWNTEVSAVTRLLKEQRTPRRASEPPKPNIPMLDTSKIIAEQQQQTGTPSASTAGHEKCITCSRSKVIRLHKRRVLHCTLCDMSWLAGHGEVRCRKKKCGIRLVIESHYGELMYVCLVCNRAKPVGSWMTSSH